MNFVGGNAGAPEGAGDRVLGAILQGGGEHQALIGVGVGQRANGAQGQAAFGQGAGLVEDHCVDLVQAFEYMATGQQ
ncbi:hypothetical protein D3C77_641700 [compost metagenome]